MFRCEGTVRRPRAPFGRATHAVLAHLRRVGFTGAPQVLAVEADTEVLSWIPGRAAFTPLPDWSLGEDTLISVAALIRQFHLAMRSFDGTGLSWARPVPPGYRGPLISHNDLHPGNVVFDGGVAVGLIDFDLAGPGSVVWDVATAVRNWCPLVDDQDVPPALADRRLQRLALFLDAYGLASADRIAVARALVPNHDWTYRIVVEAAKSGHPGFRDYWREVARRTDRARDWTCRHGDELIAAVS
ncbi:phosphotransferase enzyme family protein [Jatrophihabitans sp.]|uniref:phosphotransferase enzyme family protein n=1 Tax=Jatrophihabitans sp. TaxID=1932789 RepID=UPI002EF363CD